MKSHDLSGMKFGRLTVIARSQERTSDGHVKWVCRCSCGNIKAIHGNNMKYGSTRSCGCLVAELNRVKAEANKIHGENAYNSRLYRIWSNMKSRCRDKTQHSYRRYGGRGIRVCKSWAESYLSFRSWALTYGYRNDLTIHRKDNDGNYCPDNCAWISRAENTRLGFNTKRARRENGTFI